MSAFRGDRVTDYREGSAARLLLWIAEDMTGRRDGHQFTKGHDMSRDNIIYGFAGSHLCLLRSDQGDGGWSLHTPEQIAEADAADDVPETVLSGPAEWDADADDWDRPNAHDVAKAIALIV